MRTFKNYIINNITRFILMMKNINTPILYYGIKNYSSQFNSIDGKMDGWMHE